ncbi:hypothetical protein BDV10DRAFT_169324, partial [Aspergillus recurvatus]
MYLILSLSLNCTFSFILGLFVFFAHLFHLLKRIFGEIGSSLYAWVAHLFLSSYFGHCSGCIKQIESLSCFLP